LDFKLRRLPKRLIVWALIAIAVAAAIYKWKFSPSEVTAYKVTAKEMIAEVMGTGTLEAHNQTTISSKIQGLIVELLVDQNDVVKEGQLLARLDDSDIRREVSGQEAILNAAQATIDRLKADEARSLAIYEQAQRDYDRYAGLLTTKSISQELMDKTVQNFAVAQADVQRASAASTEAFRQMIAAQEKLQYQKAKLSDTRILSPFDGVIVKRDRELGDIVVPGASIFLLVSPKEMWISAWVDESEISKIAPNQPARIVYRSEPQKKYSGKVVRVGREVDRETREFRVDVGVDTLAPNWAVGQRAEVYIETKRAQNALTAPLKSIVWKNGKPAVYILYQGRARLRPVTLGLKGIDQVQITEGIKADEMVITGPSVAQIQPGRRVTAK
jgi:HlyD family secretion protein